MTIQIKIYSIQYLERKIPINKINQNLLFTTRTSVLFFIITSE